jgi:hypothetical protein
MKSGNLNLLEPSGLLQACIGFALALLYLSGFRLPLTAVDIASLIPAIQLGLYFGVKRAVFESHFQIHLVPELRIWIGTSIRPPPQPPKKHFHYMSLK